MASPRLQRTALRAHEERANYLTRWWSKKYKRPPNHPLLLERTSADLQIEMLEDLAERRDELRAQLEDAQTHAEGGGPERRAGMAKIRRAIREIGEALGCDEATDEEYDPVVAEWDRALDAGDLPDLGKGTT